MNHHTLFASALATFGLFFTASANAGAGFPELASPEKVDACVNAIAARADYTGATRVRHEVESRLRRSYGHKLIIDTTVYGNGGERVIREYAAVCVIAGGAQPLTFEIEEVRPAI